ncbi:MAG: hypothetical protein JO321_10555 [Solirubrobacterales bacterium]|nr:hypothetical protein [Solirubrobacterales bacterium]MBV9535838.1 hypothetical protein [Solirubrobacterales bacterium]
MAYYWVDAGNGVMASMTVYEDRTGEEASNEMAVTWIRENAANLFPHPAEVTPGRVVARG